MNAMENSCSENGKLAEGLHRCVLNHSNNCKIGNQLIKRDDVITNKRKPISLIRPKRSIVILEH